jgi:TPR repeat protein
MSQNAGATYPLLKSIRSICGTVIGCSPHGRQSIIHNIGNKLIEARNTPKLYNLVGMHYMFEKKDFDTAKEYFKKAIRRGNIFAMNNLSVINYVLKHDVDRAKKYAQKGVAKNNPVSQRLLGCYNICTSNQRDIKKGLKLLQKAAKKKDYDAICFIARYYEVNGHVEKAHIYYSMLKTAGEIERYKYGCAFMCKRMIDMKVNDKAIEYGLIAQSTNTSHTLMDLYNICSTSGKNLDEHATQFLELAVKKGHPQALTIMGRKYFTIKNPTEDEVIAGLMCIIFAKKQHEQNMHMRKLDKLRVYKRTRLPYEKAFKFKIIEQNLLTNKVFVLMLENNIRIDGIMFTSQIYDALHKNKKLYIDI